MVRNGTRRNYLKFCLLVCLTMLDSNLNILPKNEKNHLACSRAYRSFNVGTRSTVRAVANKLILLREEIIYVMHKTREEKKYRPLLTTYGIPCIPYT